MSRKGENIYKRKDGRWEGRYIKGRSNTGKALYGYVYARSYREVKSKLVFSIQSTAVSHTMTNPCAEYSPLTAANHQEISNPPTSAKTGPQIPTITFRNLADSWISSIKPQIKESTYMKYRNSLKNYILPVLGDEPAANISYSILDQFAANLLMIGGQKGEGLSPKTVTDTISIVRTILQHADKNGFEISCSGRGIHVKQDPGTLHVLSLSEQQQLQQYLTANLTHRNLGLLLCLFTGIRIGEICALKWEDVSLEDRQVRVQHTLQRLQCENDEKKTRIVVTTPKSRCSDRTIPLPDAIVDLIRENFEHRSGYLLTGREDKYVEPRTMQNHFKRILSECQIREVNYHALRHSFATRCIELGFDVKSLSEILGHASVNITMNRYVHPSMELKRENMNRFTDLFSVR